MEENTKKRNGKLRNIRLNKEKLKEKKIYKENIENEKAKGLENKKSKLNESQKMVYFFFIYSFIGWLLETIFCFVTLGYVTKRGFLYGPLCPIYGFGAVILIMCLRSVKTNTVGKFCISFIAFTAFEYVVAVVLEEIFGLRWWDYSDIPLNFQGRICLGFSIVWGLLGLIFVDKVHPAIKSKFEKLTSNITKKRQILVLNILIATIMIDFILSIAKYINI